jgi:hypothetical protein
MKIHYGFFENCGDYESPLYICENTICGCSGEKVVEEYTIDYWEDVTCKKCLKLKDAVIKGEKLNEEAIVNQMGDMADFFEELIK